MTATTNDQTGVLTEVRVGYRVPEVAKAVGLSEDTIRRSIVSGHIAATRVGKAYIVPAHELRRLFGAVPMVLTM